MDASISSSSSVAGLHGGDLRSPNGELSSSPLLGGGRLPYRLNQQQQRQHGRTSVMDNGRSAYANNHYRTPNASSSMTSAESRINRLRPPVNLSPKKKSRVIIDLIDVVGSPSSPQRGEEGHDELYLAAAARKKRSLQRNIHTTNVYNKASSTTTSTSSVHGSSYSLSTQYSPPPRQQKRTRVGALQQHQQQQQQHQAPPPINHITLPSRGTQDGATITFGLLSLIDILNRNNYDNQGRRSRTNNDNSNNTRFCEGCYKSSMDKLYKPLDPTVFGAAATSCNSSSLQLPTTTTVSPIPLPYNHQPFHYLQNDNWSCGYRNLQMLLSSMLPTLHTVYPDGVPSINEIQITMEKLWKYGFDGRNAEHHEHALVGKQSWIGTVEVWYVLYFIYR